jgi:hypothetical protein
MPFELTEEEELGVAILISQEEDSRAFSGYEDALALSVTPGPPPMQPPCIPLARPRREARVEP